jgi:hypothetical protein
LPSLTASRTLKIAVVAPVARASVRTTVAVTIGVARIRRLA